MVLFKVLYFGLLHHLCFGGTFWYLTDLHYDPTYNITDESCNEVHNDSDNGPYGSYECDSPWKLVDSSVRQMKQQLGTPNFIVLGGDNGHHTLKKTTIYTEDYMAEIATNITSLLKEVFPGVSVLPVLGNHDWWPKTQLPQDGSTSNNDLYDRYYDMWTEWIPKDQESYLKKAGYFKVTLDEDKIVAVVLNTNLYLEKNMAASGPDPGGQLAWLVNQLNETRIQGRKVHLFTHVPVSHKEMVDDYNQKLSDIIRDYSDVLHATYSAHRHTDDLSLIFDNGTNPVACHIVVPSVTPWRWAGDATPRNPTFRKLTYNDNGELTDWVQYYLDLPVANQGRPMWKVLYTFSKAYDVPNITPRNLYSFYKELQSHGNQKWQEYYKNIYVNVGPQYNKPCECECKEKVLCGIRHVKNSPYQKCLDDTAATCRAASLQIMAFLQFLCLLLLLL